MMKLKKKLLPGHIALLLAAAVPPAAWAQQTTPDTDDAQALGTIIVTAEKRSEDIQEVPMSISVINVDDLEKLHATQLTDFAGYVPGFIVQDGGAPGQATLALRGIPPLSAGSTVATYIDETPLGSSSNYGAGSNVILDLLPYDFQSFEVLRGPQGTLYGASSLGGLVRYTTSAPDTEHSSGRAGVDVSSVSGGSDMGFGLRGAFNMVMSPGKLALTASAAHQDNPGYIDNVRTGEKDQNASTQDAGRVALRWTPNDDVAVTLQALTQRTDSDSSSTVALESRHAPAALRLAEGRQLHPRAVPARCRLLHRDAELESRLGRFRLGDELFGDRIARHDRRHAGVRRAVPAVRRAESRNFDIHQ